MQMVQAFTKVIHFGGFYSNTAQQTSLSFFFLKGAQKFCSQTRWMEIRISTM